ncbi:MAG TPA: N-acyl homoserine lactonase family protein [Caulobacteraceae bacterium]|nr:N-acyl homoserine lactonase family protein [Caulobacteraceae bacterium]
MPAPYEVYAIRYARHADRTARQNFIGDDAHDGPSPLDFFVWLARGEAGTFLVDTGFDDAMAARRGRDLLTPVAEGLAALGVDAGAVKDVIITHMHYDHAGNHALFPAARYHLQDDEMAYATGRWMTHAALRQAYTADDVAEMVRKVFADRVVFHAGDAELAPGLSLHLIGGHTQGMQVVRIWTRRGWLVLASDAAHLYANMDEGRPFPIVHDVAAMLEGHRTLKRLASHDDLVIPGHDPLVLERFRPPDPALAGLTARLDADPVGGGRRA